MNWRANHANERTIAVIKEWIRYATKFHLIYNSSSGGFIMDWPYEEDPDHGLPEWYFEKDHWTHFTVDLSKDFIEWVPPMGPAPCWEGKFSAYTDTDHIFTVWSDWAKKTYG